LVHRSTGQPPVGPQRHEREAVPVDVVLDHEEFGKPCAGELALVPSAIGLLDPEPDLSTSANWSFRRLYSR